MGLNGVVWSCNSCNTSCWGRLQSAIKQREKSSGWENTPAQRVSFCCPLCLFFFFSTPIGEWPSPLPTPCRTSRTPPSTATMTAAWRSRKLRAASHRLVRASGPWPCLRTTTREPLRMEALERPSTPRTVWFQSPVQSVVWSPWICI